MDPINLFSVNSFSGSSPLGRIEEPDTVNVSLFTNHGQNSGKTQEPPKTVEECQKRFGMSGPTIETASVINKDGSTTDIHQLEDGTGEIRVTTSKNKNTKSYAFYKYDFSDKDPIGIFNVRKWTDENGKVVGYTTDFIDNLGGFARN